MCARKPVFILEPKIGMNILGRIDRDVGEWFIEPLPEFGTHGR